jgi:predicted Fe-Mo cluster-binding NifX family protein
MHRKILLPLYGKDVAPRFDLASEAVIVSLDEQLRRREEKLVVLPQVSAEKLCHLILTEGVKTVICCAIEEEYFQYLTWKRIEVYDSIIGEWETALNRYLDGSLSAGDILEVVESSTKE